jgi:hypothetical protein
VHVHVHEVAAFETVHRWHALHSPLRRGLCVCATCFNSHELHCVQSTNAPGGLCVNRVSMVCLLLCMFHTTVEFTWGALLF